MGKYLNYILVILTIFTSGSVYHQMYGNILSPLFIVILSLAFWANAPIVSRFSMKLILVGILCVSIVLLLNYLLGELGNSIWFYIKFFLRIVSTFLLILYYKNTRFDLKRDIIFCLYVLAFHAVISFLIFPFIENYLVSIPTEELNGKTFYNLFFYSSLRDVFGINIYRNQGVFWEPGILQIYMNILVFYNLFEKKSFKKSLFPALIVVSTMSTTGLGLLLILYISYYFSIHTHFSIKFFLLSLFFFILMIPLVLAFANNLGEKKDTLSYQLRMYDMVNAIEMVIQHPICGIGFDMEVYKKVQTMTNLSKYANLNIYDGDMIYERGNTNSLLMLLIQCGLPMSVVYLCILYRQNIFLNRRLFFFVIIISLMSEPLLLGNFFILFFVESFFTILSRSKVYDKVINNNCYI